MRATLTGTYPARPPSLLAATMAKRPSKLSSWSTAPIWNCGRGLGSSGGSGQRRRVKPLRSDLCFSSARLAANRDGGRLCFLVFVLWLKLLLLLHRLRLLGGGCRHRRLLPFKALCLLD